MSKLRDIMEYEWPLDDRELRHLQVKIAAAGEMKSAIKKYLDSCENCIANRCGKHKRLRRSMENYLNGVYKSL